jgi:putative FmdB family regulatory protein
MPIYEYECSTCKHRFERFQRFSDAALTECPECGAAVHRVIHAAGIVFKGSGWYITDSRKSPPSESAGADSKADTKTESKTDTKTESKVDSKPAAKTNGATAAAAASGSKSPSAAKAD